MVNKVLGLLLGLMICVAAAYAEPIFEQGSTAPTSSITSVTAAIPASSTVVTLAGPAHSCIIKSDSGAAAMFIRFDGGTATAANFKIDGGTSQSFQGMPGFNNVSILGATATGNYSICAW